MGYKNHTLSSFLQSISHGNHTDQFVIYNIQDILSKITYGSEKHMEDFFTFVLVNTGKTSYKIDDHNYSTTDKTIYFTNPGHLKSFQFTKGTDGFIIFFSQEYLKTNLDEDPLTKFSYLLLENVAPQHISTSFFNDLWSICQNIILEKKKDNPQVDLVVATFFKLFLLKLSEKIYYDYNSLEEGDRKSEIVRTFKINLESEIREIADGVIKEIGRDVDFAKKQKQKPEYFSLVIKAKTGRSANKWISNKMIQEAKSLLTKSDLSIKEVANRLGFQDSNYFTKYFRKYTGHTPGNYRKSES